MAKHDVVQDDKAAAELRLIVVGYGNIARYWLEHFASRLPVGVSVLAVINSKGVVSGTQPLQGLANDSVEHDTASLVQALITQTAGSHTCVLDLTASKGISRCYPAWIRGGAHLISANKYAGSSALGYYESLQNELKQQQKYWLHNTTVGAGLPIQSAIAERLRCHDEIIAIEGNLSGSLSWIFQQYRKGDLFSDWLRRTAELGMTEPDPRTDLAGMDVARKLLILARESGWRLKLADIEIENLVPEDLRQLTVEQFWSRIDEVDATIASRPGEQFHYVGRIEKRPDGHIEASARLQAIEAESPYASLPPGNANFKIQSRQYFNNPLLIQGPGAGREVTAAGVHSDVLSLLRLL